MKNKILLLALLIGPAIANAQPDVTGKIKALNKEMEQEFNGNNMLKVSAFYLDSAAIIGGGMNVTGRKDIDMYWMSLKDKSASWKLETDKIEDYGIIVIQRGRSYLSFSSGGQSNVRFILIWKKIGDSYSVLYDTFTRL
jgi:ketosteroid isomerase-like protein